MYGIWNDEKPVKVNLLGSASFVVLGRAKDKDISLVVTESISYYRLDILRVAR